MRAIRFAWLMLILALPSLATGNRDDGNNSTSSSNSDSHSRSNSNSVVDASSSSLASAEGGAATATGGSASSNSSGIGTGGASNASIGDTTNRNTVTGGSVRTTFIADVETGPSTSSAIAGDSRASIGDTTVTGAGGQGGTGNGGSGISEATAEGGKGGSVTYNEAEQPKSITIKNTPTAVAPDVFPTVSCFKGGSGAFSGPGFGVSVGAGKIDKGCVEREEIRLAAAFGLIDRALFRWCNLENNLTSFGSLEACLTFGAEEEPEPEIIAYTQPEQLMAEISEEDQAKIDRVTEIDKEVEQLLREITRLKAKERERNAADQRREQQIEDYKTKWEKSPGVDDG